MKPSGVLLVLLIAPAFFTIIRAQTPCPPSTPEISADPRDPYPNELDGYRFFRDGKLKNLRLGVSTRADVEKIFGPPRKPGIDFLTYQYDADWDIKVLYYSPDNSVISYQEEIDGVTVQYRRLPKPETFGKVREMTLIPQKPVWINLKPACPPAAWSSGGPQFLNPPVFLTYNLRFDKNTPKTGNEPVRVSLLGIIYFYGDRYEEWMFLRQKLDAENHWVDIPTVVKAPEFFNLAEPYRYELEGYRFFTEGQLKTIRPGVSTREDLERIFGPPRRSGNYRDVFQYDAFWTMQVNYYYPDQSITESIFENGTQIDRRTVLKPEYANTVQSIHFQPKTPVLLDPQVIKPSLLKEFGKLRADGLDYQLTDEETEDGKPYLKSIEYFVPHYIEKKWFKKAR